jgi:hypothetical protein
MAYKFTIFADVACHIVLPAWIRERGVCHMTAPIPSPTRAHPLPFVALHPPKLVHAGDELTAALLTGLQRTPWETSVAEVPAANAILPEGDSSAAPVGPPPPLAISANVELPLLAIPVANLPHQRLPLAPLHLPGHLVAPAEPLLCRKPSRRGRTALPRRRPSPEPPPFSASSPIDWPPRRAPAVRVCLPCFALAGEEKGRGGAAWSELRRRRARASSAAERQASRGELPQRRQRGCGSSPRGRAPRRGWRGPPMAAAAALQWPALASQRPSPFPQGHGVI